MIEGSCYNDFTEKFFHLLVKGGVLNKKAGLMLLFSLIILACQAIQPNWNAKSTPIVEPVSEQKTTDIQAICRQNVDSIRKLRKDFPTPDLIASKGVRTTNDFDVNQYFSIFSHLKLEDRFQLDYVYDLSGIGGRPLIYAVPNGTPVFHTFQEYVDFAAKGEIDPGSYKPYDHTKDYLTHIQVDNSPEGYFQYQLLYSLGDQFYLVWHANYNDSLVLCDSSDLKEVAKEMGAFNLTFPPETATKIKSIDFSPSINPGTTAISILFVQFSKWYGFREMKYTIERKFPHQVTVEPFKALVEYDCGIKF
jgi:hypothetical protein